MTHRITTEQAAALLAGITPGPWKASYTAPSQQVTVMRGNFCVVDCGRGDGALDNARAIAAVPSLLADLLEARAQNEKLRVALRVALGESSDMTIPEVRAALSAVEGK